jgi:hypothetical protein
MTSSEIRQLVRALPSETAIQCADALDAGLVSAIVGRPGNMLASEALATFSIRQVTAKNASIEVLGFEELFLSLRRLRGNERVTISSFFGKEFIFTLFTSSS